MKKIKTNLHALNKHIFLGFSFCVFALIVSVYWGLTYAEGTSLLSTSPLTDTSAITTPVPTTSDPSLSIPPATETITSTNQCTELRLTLTDNKTSYYIGDTVNYTWTCNTASTYNYISIFLQKPDQTSHNINNVTGTTAATYGSFDTSNLVAGNYTLKACLSTSCSPDYPSSSQSFSLIAKTVIAPTNLTATVTGSNVVLNWVDKSDNEAGFKIYRGPTWTDIGNVGPNVTTFTDYNRPAGTYTYKLNAFNSSNIYSPVSNEVSATISSQTVTQGTGGENTTTNTCTSLKLSLNNNKTSYIVGDTVNYIWECIPSGSTGTVSVALQKPDGSLSVYNTGTSSRQSLGFSTLNLTPGSYILKACLGTSCSPNYPSSTQVFYLTARDTTSSGEILNNGLVSTIPIAPSSLSKEIIYSSGKPSVKLTWKDNSTNETKFVIRRKLSSDTSYGTFVRNIYPNVVYYLDSDSIISGLSYDYSLAACNSDTVCSGVIEIKNILIPQAVSTDTTVRENLLVPIAPTGLSLPVGTILSETSKFIPLKWIDNSTNEDKWNIERRINGGAWMYLHQIAGANVTYYADYSAIPGNVYDYRVQACLSGTGCSSSAILEKVAIPAPKVIAPVATPTVAPSDSTNTITNTNTETKKIEEVVAADKNITENNLVTSAPTVPTVTESLPITNKEIAETISVISQSPVINENIKTEIANTEETSKVVKLVYQDTNKDGISDYESKYVYNIDPVKKSPTSVYEGKTITAADKILLGFDPSKKELVKVVKQEPISSTAPIVNTYKVNKVELVKGQNKVVLKGQALPNSFITLYVYSTPIIVTVKTDSRGEWQYLLDKELEDGTHTVYTATVNNTGNIVAQSSPYSFTKTAEAASLKDIPVAGASVGVEKPGFLGTKNIFIITIGIVLVVGIILILIGLFTKKVVPTSSN